MTEQSPTLTVDQALFGYSDGHRQLAASVELSSADAYELATRSDLASNARLGSGASYVGGFPLKESGGFAYVKTWPAPEMSRPGCVWSHVLILSRSFLTGQVNLGILQKLFKKPRLNFSLEDYRSKIHVKRLAKTPPADADEVRKIVSAYYGGQSLLYGELPGEKFEGALLAVWSQQWPKLRSDFLFRMVFGSTVVLDKGLIVRIASSHSASSSNQAGKTTDPVWIAAAAEDATSPTITPLRRFLWRYGKDAIRPRSAFEPLVRLYLEGSASNRPTDDMLSWFPKPLDAVTLKRDMLGVPTGAPPLARRLDGPGFVTLATTIGVVENGLIKPGELLDAVSSFDQGEMKRAAIALGDLRDAASSDAALIKDGLATSIESKALSDEAMPKEFVVDVLCMRPELVEEFDVARLDECELIRLLDVASRRSAVRRLIGSLMASPPSEEGRTAVERRIGDAFVEAVRLSKTGSLHRGWRQVFTHHARRAISDGLVDLNGPGEVGRAVSLIDFSTDHHATPADFAEAYGREGPKATAEERTALNAYLLVLCMQFGLAKSMGIVEDVLPRLREVALANGFSTRIRGLLDKHLPYLSDSWDFNKRLLKLLRRAQRDGVVVDGVVAAMHLSEPELLYVFDEDRDGFENLVSRLFWPWSRM